MKPGTVKAKEVCHKLDFPDYGYMYKAILNAIKQQDKDTRRACADACLRTMQNAPHLKTVAWEYHDICMNVKAV